MQYRQRERDNVPGRVVFGDCDDDCGIEHRFRNCSFGRCGVADGGYGLCGLTNATSTLPSWIGVKDDLSVVGFFLWLPSRHTSDSKCSRHVDMPCHFDWGFVRCRVCSWIRMACEWRCRVFNNRHFCSFDEWTVLRTSRREWKLFLPSSCDFA